MTALATRSESSPEVGEVQALARQLAAAYQDHVAQAKHELGMTTQEAVAKVDEPSGLSRLLQILDRPPEQVSWADLEEVARTCPERAVQRWEEVKHAALEELRSGHRAGGVLQGRDPHPWRLAQYLAIRAELTEGWQPRNGIERQLIDQMAQAQAAMHYWQEYLADRACGRLQEADQAAAMVDRFQKMFLRTLRALCNMRKVPLAVVVQNAGQVNIGGQQVNLSDSGPGAKDRPCSEFAGGDQGQAIESKV
jgi:hypothetical protein